MAISPHIAGAMERASWIRRMFERGAELKAEHGAENVFDFTLGNPIHEPPAAFFDALRELSEQRAHGFHRYMPNAGYADVREAVAGQITKDGIFDAKPETTIMTVGAGGALNVVLKTLLGDGDQVVIQDPFFVEYLFYITNHGGEPVRVPPPADFGINLEAIDAAITERTAAVILNTPNNPSGVVYSRAQCEQLAGVLRAASERVGRPVYLISDEPYRDLGHTDEPIASPCSFYENSLWVFSWSKGAAIPGDRIGVVSAHPGFDDDLIGPGLTFANRTLGFVNAPATMQRCIPALLGASVGRDDYRAKAKQVTSALDAMGLEYP
ncbi:MAG: aminotransferase class I/II-fold pyridoxal phosphate-dependent enzyme, partial [Planctomycetota bacterium]